MLHSVVKAVRKYIRKYIRKYVNKPSFVYTFDIRREKMSHLASSVCIKSRVSVQNAVTCTQEFGDIFVSDFCSVLKWRRQILAKAPILRRN